jgi:hypothetical protein
VAVYQKCDQTGRNLQSTFQKFGEDSVKTREAETEHIFCIWSHMVSNPSIWNKFTECRNHYPTQIKDKCREEIRAYVSSL